MGEALFAKTRFQAFVFAGGVIMVLYSLAEKDPTHSTKVADRIVWVSLAAMFVFVIALIINAIWPGRGPSSQPERPALAAADTWPNDRDIRFARGFMVLGLLIYIGYHFLDGFVMVESPAAVGEILRIRIAVSVVIALLWLISFSAWFRRHYVPVVTFGTFVAGLGVAAMMFIAGNDVHFYYEGFIQVIAFAAFAFRLPPRPLAWECALLLLIYGAIVFSQNWQPGQGFVVSQEMKAVLANNVVSLVTFVALAITGSVALSKSR